ncbi:Hypothetical protein SRAE_0000061000 [Strongyloides ratti]|uniref:Integrase, catalytic core domain and Ribonuclease H-like domain-containing protein n=1 Tax=Strongyloides ratti TaxID=34506 RepID=A0A090L024_STRRB|nr:Hypothetical protein SRAE_0000061000 [Strongyloides ratti]CEF61487.1 Hypothetical protein SRAE_0000061000 [Strongyloides ratti]
MFLEGKTNQSYKNSSFHPMSNGHCESLVKTFKSSMKKMVNSGVGVDEALDRFLFNFRIVSHDHGKESLSEFLFGKRLRLNLDGLREERFQVLQVPEVSKFQEGENVYVRDYKLDKNWEKGKVNKVGGQNSLLCSNRNT